MIKGNHATSKTYEATPEGKHIYYAILQMIDAHCQAYNNVTARDFVSGIVLGKQEYELLAGHLMNDPMQPQYAYAATLPEDLRGIPLIVTGEPGVHLGIKPYYISLHGLPSL